MYLFTDELPGRGSKKSKPWKCDECGLSYSYARKLEHHKKMKHEGGYKDTDEGKADVG